ncbi:hypothetical protein B0H16DRAFT_1722291 [Mycena metata]|uniref:Uncharacterized protein n=1 Tax=Mycena metata TaxID=1033252 RepID=A0AAD7J5N7_9AGAR|nr:hypothetical protein B0H16DRAFT_1722291 [Mycena metata]
MPSLLEHKCIRGPRRRISPRRLPPCITKLPPSVQAHIPSDLRTSHALIKPHPPRPPSQAHSTYSGTPPPVCHQTTTLPRAPPLPQPVPRISRTLRPRAPDVCDVIAAASPHPADSQHRAPPTAESTARHAPLTRPARQRLWARLPAHDGHPATAPRAQPNASNASASPHPAPSTGASLHLDADASASWVRFAFAVHDIVRW